MKNVSAGILGLALLFAAGCSNQSEVKQAEGEESGEAGSEEITEDQQTEIDMEGLIEQMVMDAEVVVDSGEVSFQFSLKNTGEDPVVLGFTSSQKYEIQVKDKEGEVVYTYSADQMFAQGLTTEEVEAGALLEASETWPADIEPGDYEATMTFLVDTINDQPLDANPFEVTQSFTLEGKDAVTEEEAKTDETGLKEAEYGKGEAFRKVTVSGEKGSYVVKGEARVFEGSFLYSVEDGHHVQVSPTPVQVEEGAPSWSPFEFNISIPEEDMPDYGMVTLILFEESSEDGRPIHLNYIPLEQVQTTE
ncbi:BsuPI-related putative proteinase inhibitor [Halobacillus litoralis]|uniref:BsuPI-related putative proteinase inhibitor n=1 Tax=Halobacillus litoralis TaxID=45668 RepID=UPI001CD69671|nr:BsuPI-related putative proteinase inhibitor [Halobacillus litoralis]MCA1022527.1 hypothetical protein [Halobacillus litoralis]